MTPDHTPLRVSVVIPVLNDADELRTCLAALAEQSVRPFEVIVVDNGCTDDSSDVARRAGARVVVEERRGIPHAAAAGYDAARGEVIARLDADSRPRPGWLAEIERVLGAPDVEAVTGWGLFHDLPRPVSLVATVAYLGSYHVGGWAAIAHPPLWGSSMAMRRTTWQQVRAGVTVEADVHDDMDLAFALGPVPGRRARRVVVSRRLRADVSARSLRGAAQRRRRMARAFTTLRVGWDHAQPWQRWHARISAQTPNAGPSE